MNGKNSGFNEYNVKNSGDSRIPLQNPDFTHHHDQSPIDMSNYFVGMKLPDKVSAPEPPPVQPHGSRVNLNKQNNLVNFKDSVSYADDIVGTVDSHIGGNPALAYPDQSLHKRGTNLQTSNSKEINALKLQQELNKLEAIRLDRHLKDSENITMLPTVTSEYANRVMANFEKQKKNAERYKKQKSTSNSSINLFNALSAQKSHRMHAESRLGKMDRYHHHHHHDHHIVEDPQPNEAGTNEFLRKNLKVLMQKASAQAHNDILKNNGNDESSNLLSDFKLDELDKFQKKRRMSDSATFVGIVSSKKYELNEGFDTKKLPQNFAQSNLLESSSKTITPSSRPHVDLKSNFHAPLASSNTVRNMKLSKGISTYLIRPHIQKISSKSGTMTYKAIFDSPVDSGNFDDSYILMDFGGVADWLMICEFFSCFTNFLEFYDSQDIHAHVPRDTSDNIKTYKTSDEHRIDALLKALPSNNLRSRTACPGNIITPEEITLAILIPDSSTIFRRLILLLLRPLVHYQFGNHDFSNLILRCRENGNRIFLSSSFSWDILNVDYLLEMYLNYCASSDPETKILDYDSIQRAKLLKKEYCFDKEGDSFLKLTATLKSSILVFLINIWSQTPAFTNHADTIFARSKTASEIAKKFEAVKGLQTLEDQKAKLLKKEMVELKKKLKKFDSDIQLCQEELVELKVKPSNPHNRELVEDKLEELKFIKAAKQSLQAEITQKSRNAGDLSADTSSKKLAGFGPYTQDDLDKIVGKNTELSNEEFKVSLITTRFYLWNQNVGYDRFGREHWIMNSIPGIVFCCSAYNMKLFGDSGIAIDDEIKNELRYEDNIPYWYRLNGDVSRVISQMNHPLEGSLVNEIYTWRSFITHDWPVVKRNENLNDSLIKESQVLHMKRSILKEMYHVSKIVAAPYFLVEGDDKYAHFCTLSKFLRIEHSDYSKNYEDLMENPLPYFKDTIAEYYDILSSVPRDRNTYRGKSKNRGKMDSNRKIFAKFSPILLSVMNENMLHVKSTELKTIEDELKQWKLVVENCESWQELLLCVRILMDLVLKQTEGNPEYDVYSNDLIVN